MSNGHMTQQPGHHTFAALITPPGEGGIGIIRLKGPHARSVMETCFEPVNTNKPEFEVGDLSYGHVTRDGHVLDEVIVARPDFDQYEINCHGGVAAVQSVFSRILSAGPVERTDWRGLLAQQQEYSPLFSQESIQTAALSYLPRAQTRLGARMLLHQSNGALLEALQSLLGRLKQGGGFCPVLSAIQQRLPLGKALLRPPKVLIAGPPNAGKSTLLNTLLKRERVIVHDTPGTTRDVVRETISIKGIPFEIIDSAGIRNDVDELEDAAISRTLNFIDQCDIILWMRDATRSADSRVDIPRISKGQRLIQLINKIDLTTRSTCRHISSEPIPTFHISAREDIGIPHIETEIIKPFEPYIDEIEAGAAVPFTPSMRLGIQEIDELTADAPSYAAQRLHDYLFRSDVRPQ